MHRILLLYISTNSGHHHAAKAIEESLHSLEPGIKTLNLNCFNYTNPILEKVINNVYNKVIKNKPEVWEYLYDNPVIVRRTRKFRKLIHEFNSKKLKKLIDHFRPDAVICTQAFPAGMIADFKKTYNLNFPLIGVLTDYSPHSYWIYDNIDTYIVPSLQTRQRFVDSFIAKDKIFIYGIPISARFGAPTDKEATFSSLKLDKNIPVLLIMGGGQGLGPIEEIIFAVNTLDVDFQVVVVCGINNKLRKWLERRQKLFRKRMAILGYSKNTNALMDIASLLVTKPGGLTTAEALTKGLPVVIVNPIPGQETKNTEFLLSEGVAVKAKDALDAAALIGELLSAPEKLRQMREASFKHARPDSAANISKLALKLINDKKKG
ncbi:MAG: glycosyltransferase [Candidatus Omnitrophica bacterium]|nr:glycosyltransferase [Candidatus Omnitrophota bacterium]MBU1925624.1 glycosyltransferase [Candidatus Omnitrophota bacterium]MBU2062920.1 glycosyltransferase [Candidatus Omnitrophota bacterium]